ncbi:MAG: hypothetical protein WC720_05035 [Candidatus Shapirobacteria bacterium]|jgi:hypothetical protein
MELYKYSWYRGSVDIADKRFMGVVWNHQLNSWTILANTYNFPGQGAISPWLYLTSDFENFTDYQATPFFWDGNSYCSPVHLIFDADISKWILVYFGPHGSGGESIAIATGNDINSLTNIHTDYVLKPNVSPAPTGSVSLFPGGFIKVGSTYWMVVDITYTSTTRVYEKRLYSSTDLINWTFDSIFIPPITLDWDDSSRYNGNWIYADGFYYYFYGGNRGGYSLDRKIGYAMCATINGTYKKMGMILDPPLEAKNPVIFYNPFTEKHELFFNEITEFQGQWNSRKALTYTNMGQDKEINNKQQTLGLYNYQSSTPGDAVGDTRKGTINGWFQEETCTNAHATKGDGTWVVTEAKKTISLIDSNVLEGAGSYVDLPAGKSGIGQIQLGTERTWFDFTVDGVVTLINNSANVSTSSEDAKLIVRDAGTNVRIVNELGSTLIATIIINYTL